MNEFTDRNKKLNEYYVKYGYKLGIRPKMSTFRKKKFMINTMDVAFILGT